ncbi:SMI1/KNR4 family protein [Streptomyces sp. MBT65]|uniref:SMI1/KNR4 family protein n=1 Tax=Streptomyces sp. MBT65 TaxID=1488395 RepID=UPI00190A54C0|nr:SMI1/KNR4 family protein [Streptomyces sp. MBT65]MBK3576239.1 SMI1/KNR4 family protein [Streptomyces sp. MBT65]
MRSDSVRGVDWRTVTRLLGIDLPTDYKEFADAYPALEVDEFLRVWSPIPSREEEFVEEILYELEILNDVQEDGATESYVAYPAPGGLLPWGGSLEGDVFYWRTSDENPDRWPVVASGRNGSWWEYEAGVLAFLTGIIDGTGARGELADGILGSDSPVVSLDA